MPLHSGDKEDRGGNDREVQYGIVPGLNLHWAWDGPLAERAISSAQPQLVRRYSLAEREVLGGGDPPDDWGRGKAGRRRATSFTRMRSMMHRATATCPKATALTQEDIAAALPVAERRITQAGLRIPPSCWTRRSRRGPCRSLSR